MNIAWAHAGESKELADEFNRNARAMEARRYATTHPTIAPTTPELPTSLLAMNSTLAGLAMPGTP